MTSSAVLIILLVLLSLINSHEASDFFGGGMRPPFDDASYYKSLGHGIDKQSNSDEIKKAYRRKAMVSHPDKGGDAEEFKSLNEAYEVLSDPQKKAVYDKYGSAGLTGANGGGRSSASASDLARDFFEGLGGSRFQQFRGYSTPLVFQLDLTLEDFYNGKEFVIPIDKLQQVKVVVEPGMFGGQELVAQAESRGQPREIILRLKETQHPIFLRKGADLLMDLKISLADALLGFRRTIKLLDGTEINIQSPNNEISGVGTVFLLPNLGMPLYRTMNNGKGRLFVRLVLEMPSNRRILSVSDKKELERIMDLLEGPSASRLDIDNPIEIDKPTDKPIENPIKGTTPNPNKTKKPSSTDTIREKTAEKTQASFIKLIPTDINNFGRVGGGAQDDDEEEDFFQRSPFSQYSFFR